MRDRQLSICAMVALACLVLLASVAGGQTQTSNQGVIIPGNAATLEGVPTVRLDATSKKASRLELDPNQAAKEALKVKVVDGHYFWVNRENLALTLSTSGGFTYLSSNEPGRYIQLRRVNDRISYVEHLDMETGSVTYWGELRIILQK